MSKKTITHKASKSYLVGIFVNFTFYMRLNGGPEGNRSCILRSIPFLFFCYASQNTSVTVQQTTLRVFCFSAFDSLFYGFSKKKKAPGAFSFWWTRGESNPCPKTSWYNFLRVHSVYCASPRPTSADRLRSWVAIFFMADSMAKARRTVTA